MARTRFEAGSRKRTHFLKIMFQDTAFMNKLMRSPWTGKGHIWSVTRKFSVSSSSRKHLLKWVQSFCWFKCQKSPPSTACELWLLITLILASVFLLRWKFLVSANKSTRSEVFFLSSHVSAVSSALSWRIYLSRLKCIYLPGTWLALQPVSQLNLPVC